MAVAKLTNKIMINITVLNRQKGLITVNFVIFNSMQVTTLSSWGQVLFWNSTFPSEKKNYHLYFGFNYSGIY